MIDKKFEDEKMIDDKKFNKHDLEKDSSEDESSEDEPGNNGNYGINELIKIDKAIEKLEKTNDANETEIWKLKGEISGIRNLIYLNDEKITKLKEYRKIEQIRHEHGGNARDYILNYR